MPKSTARHVRAARPSPRPAPSLLNLAPAPLLPLRTVERLLAIAMRRGADFA